jgi:hypothetical protein
LKLARYSLNIHREETKSTHQRRSSRPSANDPRSDQPGLMLLDALLNSSGFFGEKGV